MNPLRPKTHKRPRHRLATLAVALGLLTATAYYAADVAWPTPVQPLAARARAAVAGVGRAVQGLSAVETDTATFTVQAATITGANECFPLHVRDTAGIGILYVHCTPEAAARDAQSVDLSENFKVPVGIARRFNFWRRIYSLWGKDQYVMHSSEYPEVVMEAYDVSRVGDGVGPVQREILVKRVAKQQRELYRSLLTTMYKKRNDEASFTPAMQRIARTMAHLTAKDKYLVAARTLRLQRGQRDFIANGLAVAPKYLPAIETEFKAQGIPVEISRLAFVESSFNLRAFSKVGASGVYQIMPATGRQYLKIVGQIDERNDPVKASRAAAKLLRLYYQMTGSWPLAITSYNHGVNGIRRATRTVGSNDIVDLINRYQGNAFGFASKNFYASFLAVYATLKDAERLFPEIPKVEALSFASVRMPKAISLGMVRKKYGVSLVDIQAYNPDLIGGCGLRQATVLPQGYVLKIPSRPVATAKAGPVTPNT